MGPLAGVMVSDYYLIKKQKLNIHELYKDRGIYWYDHGVNWRAFLAFVIGFGPCMPGFAKSIQPTLNVGGAWQVSLVVLPREKLDSKLMISRSIVVYLRLAIRVLRFSLIVLCHCHIHLKADERTGGVCGVSSNAWRCYANIRRGSVGEGTSHFRWQRSQGRGLRAEGDLFLGSVSLPRSSAIAISLICSSLRTTVECCTFA